jgi:elongation factor Ts
MIELVKKLRVLTNAGLLFCKKALQESDGTIEGAVKWLRENGHGRRGSVLRETKEGLAYAYQHPGGQVAVLVEVNCVTDFTARTDIFQNLCKELAMQIAATPPKWVSVEDIPSEEHANQHTSFSFEVLKTRVADKDDIVEGLMEAWYKEVCLLSQTYNRDRNRVVGDLVDDVVRATGEPIVVQRFVRYAVERCIYRPSDRLV